MKEPVERPFMFGYCDNCANHYLLYGDESRCRKIKLGQSDAMCAQVVRCDRFTAKGGAALKEGEGMKPFKFEIDEESDASIKDFGHKMKSIIDLYYEETAAKLDGEILSAVHKVGIHVDKDRLRKALHDARAFYGEGFADGRAEAQKWIPVTERLPNREEKVLCYHKFSGEDWTDWEDTVCENTFNGFCVGSGGRKAVWEWQSDFVTHWMPLPQPPKEGKG